MTKHKYRMFQIDAFEWLAKRAEKSIHAVVTDPPYGVIEYLPEQLNKQRNGNGGIWRLPKSFDGQKRNPSPRFTIFGPLDWDRIMKFHERLAPLLYNVLVPGGHVIMSSQNLISHLAVYCFLDSGFELRGQIIRIVKTLRGGDRPKNAHEQYTDVSVSPRSCYEPWLIFRRPCQGTVRENLQTWRTGGLRRVDVNKPFSDVIISRPCRGIEKQLAPHPSLKPQSFMRKIVWAALPLSEGLILDPFMGSGSTLAAAESLGLRSLGLELDSEYFKMAKKAIPALTKLPTNEDAQSFPLEEEPSQVAHQRIEKPR
jgi:DNA modification methylase